MVRELFFAATGLASSGIPLIFRPSLCDLTFLAAELNVFSRFQTVKLPSLQPSSASSCQNRSFCALDFGQPLAATPPSSNEMTRSNDR